MRRIYVSATQPGSGQIGPTEIGTYQKGPKQIRSTKVGLMQVDSSQFSFRSVYAEFVAHVLAEPVLVEKVALLQVLPGHRRTT
jgi:hypothetical protein